MFTSCFGVCMCEVYVSILYILFPTSALGALGVLIMTVSSCTDTHGRARTHQMLQWCVCDAANDSSRAAVWGHMLSLITTERSGLALINSTDVTISIPLHKDSTVQYVKNAAVCIQLCTNQESADASQDNTEAQQGRRNVSIVTARWVEMLMFIVELQLWILLSARQDVNIIRSELWGNDGSFYWEVSFSVTGFRKTGRIVVWKSWLWRFVLAPGSREKGPHFSKMHRTQNYAYSIHRETACREGESL